MSEQGDASLESQPTVTTGTGFADAVSQVLECQDEAAVASAVASGVDRFTTLRKVGEGGMGVVYEADDSQFGRRVALKKLTGDRLRSLAIGLAVCTVLLGVASTFAGFGRVLGLAVGYQVAGSPEKAFELLLVGAREAFGNLAPSATLGAILAMVLALVARANARWREKREAAAAGR